MRNHPFHTVLRMRFHNLSLLWMTFLLPCPRSLLLRAVLSPGSSIKLSHVFLRSAVHSLSHHYTISLHGSCWNGTLRTVQLLPGVPTMSKAGGSLTARRARMFCKGDPQALPLRSVCIHILKKLRNAAWSTYWSNNLCPRESIRKNKIRACPHPVGFKRIKLCGYTSALLFIL